MKPIYLLIYIILLTLFLNVVSKAQYSEQFKKYDSLNFSTLLQEWKMDSLGCLKLRNYTLTRYIVEKLDVFHKKQNDICNLIGNPNRITKERIYINRINREDDFLVYDYFFDTYCENDTLIFVPYRLCWLSVYFDTQTWEVVSIHYTCN